MLSFPEDEREVRSVNSISRLESEFVSYKRIINAPYEGLPPCDTCSRPHDISLEPGPKRLTGRHYGNYKSNTDAILDCVPEENTIYLFFECDAVLNDEPDFFIDKVKEADEISRKYGYNFFSFGTVRSIDREYDNHYSSTFFIESHAYLIPFEKLEYIQDMIRRTTWDTFDYWVTYDIKNHVIGYFKEPIALQAKGVSLIDKFEKGTA